MKVYTKKHLLDKLAENGLPSSYKSLLKLEKDGVVPREASPEGVGSARNWRLYTEKEINSIVEKVKRHVGKS